MEKLDNIQAFGTFKMLVICSDSSVDIFERIHYLRSSKCGSLAVWCFFVGFFLLYCNTS